MKKMWMTLGMLVLVSSVAQAVTITENGGAPSFTAFPGNLATGLGSGTPYWDNHSNDGGGAGSNTGNIGYCLTGTGTCTPQPGNVSPTSYLSQTVGAGPDTPNDSPTSFNFTGFTSLVITVVGLHTTDNNQTVGIYNASTGVGSDTNVFTAPITLGSVSANEGAFATNLGFYLSKGCCTGTTWYTNDALNANGTTGDPAGHQHFALFTTANANVFYLGIEDWVANAAPSEGLGDYNDVILKLDFTSAQGVPEPATFALMGAGLLGLGYARFRSRKNRP